MMANRCQICNEPIETGTLCPHCAEVAGPAGSKMKFRKLREIEIMNLLSYKGDPALKSWAVSEAKRHAAEDLLIAMMYCRGDQGCSVGCFTRDPDGGHSKYPELLGLPVWLAYIQDAVFEELSAENDRHWWHQAFFEAIPVGADLTLAAPRLLRLFLGLCVFDDEQWPRIARGVANMRILFDEWINTGTVSCILKFEAIADDIWGAPDWTCEAARCAAESIACIAESAQAFLASKDYECAGRSASEGASWGISSAIEGGAPDSNFRALAEKVLAILSECPVVGVSNA